MPNYIGVQCAQCEAFQVVQQPKSKKWKCRMCDHGQSVVRLFAGSSKAAEVRPVVQRLNRLRGRKAELEEELLEMMRDGRIDEETIRAAAVEEGITAPPAAAPRQAPAESASQSAWASLDDSAPAAAPAPSLWGQFVDVADRAPEADAQRGDGDNDASHTTDRDAVRDHAGRGGPAGAAPLAGTGWSATGDVAARAGTRAPIAGWGAFAAEEDCAAGHDHATATAQAASGLATEEAAGVGRDAAGGSAPRGGGGWGAEDPAPAPAPAPAPTLRPGSSWAKFL
ncbi:hypothetical protein FNF31_05323 [Cafeteria roenbergensis]|uniref:MRN complex-interacting protein N-terminal domain-containing protein n=1 Tax=Cafeteria roenbergensis TaxID=33653 RepID=A0A5A8CZH4_CAFRO|nr:hypothetical protein FNF31_05323 [Cafeteria roenbergensis]